MSKGGREQSFFFIMGLAFATAGLVHKKEWKENRKQWHKRRKIVMIISMIALAALIAILIAMMIIRA